MGEIAQVEAVPEAIHLPVWWRCLLIAVAMVILCACAAPRDRTQLSADSKLAEERAQGQQQFAAPPIMEQVLPPEGMEISPESLGVVGGPGEIISDESGAEIGDGEIVSDDGGSVPRCLPMANGCDAGCGMVADPYGPVQGPGDEYLCDGGDFVTPVGVHADWTITGLEQEDAIAHYDTVSGGCDYDAEQPGLHLCAAVRGGAAGGAANCAPSSRCLSIKRWKTSHRRRQWIYSRS